MSWRILKNTLLAVLALSACSTDKPLSTGPSYNVVTQVASVIVSPATASVAQGSTVQLRVVLRDGQGRIVTGPSITWKTNGPAIATVSSGGVVTGIAQGTTTINAFASGRSGSVTVTVTTGTTTTTPVASVTVSPATKSLTVGGTSQLSAVLKDTSGAILTGRTVTWTSNAASVASVSASGMLTAIAAGSATITASSGGKSGSAAVTDTASSGGGGGVGGGGAGTGTPGTIYNWGFEGPTDIAASGVLVNSHLQPFLGNSVWHRDPTTFMQGGQGVRQVLNATTANTGDAFFFHDAPRTKVFIRFNYRQSAPYNQFGTTSNYDQVKLLRGKRAGISGDPWALFISNSLGSAPGRLEFRFAEADAFTNYLPNTNLPAPNMNSLLGTWVNVELMVDMTTSNALAFQIWVNGVLYFDYTGARAIQKPSTGTFEWYQFRGTTNSMQQTSTDWMDAIGISTSRMGP